MKRVESYCDLVSPYSYLAYGRVGRICEEHGAELILRPMLLGAVQKAVGLQAPIEIRPKARNQRRTSVAGRNTMAFRCSSLIPSPSAP
jgi:2-hydroxychromene-2-carboxylate isomerase